MLARIVTALTIIATASLVVAMPTEQVKRGTVCIFTEFMDTNTDYIDISLGSLPDYLRMHRECWKRMYLHPRGIRHLRQLHRRAYLS